MIQLAYFFTERGNKLTVSYDTVNYYRRGLRVDCSKSDASEAVFGTFGDTRKKFISLQSKGVPFDFIRFYFKFLYQDLYGSST